MQSTDTVSRRMSDVAGYEAEWYEENAVGWQQAGEIFARSVIRKSKATLPALQTWEVFSIYASSCSTLAWTQDGGG
jgi:hypothetical protein